MKTINEIINEVMQVNAITTCNSFYFEVKNTLIRFSNHLPKMENINLNNPEINDFLFIFIGIKENESTIEKYFESNMIGRNWEFVVVEDDSFEQSIQIIKNKISNI